MQKSSVNKNVAGVWAVNVAFAAYGIKTVCRALRRVLPEEMQPRISDNILGFCPEQKDTVSPFSSLTRVILKEGCSRRVLEGSSFSRSGAGWSDRVALIDSSASFRWSSRLFPFKSTLSQSKILYVEGEFSWISRTIFPAPSACTMPARMKQKSPACESCDATILSKSALESFEIISDLGVLFLCLHSNAPLRRSL